MKKVLNIKVLEHTLECELSDGKIYQYDMSDLLFSEAEMEQDLKNPTFFKKAFIELGAVAWPNGYEIHAETIARDGKVISEKAS